MRITRFEDIEGWKAGRTLARAVSQITRTRGFSDRVLIHQIRKHAISIMANIAEGFETGTHPEFARFLRISLRSGSELQSHLHIALDEHYIDSQTFDRLYTKAKSVKALIGGMLRYLRRSQ